MSAVVKSADRTLAILELLIDHPDGLTLVEIQRELDIPKSSTYMLLTTMASRGFLEQDPGSRRFRVGIRLWQAGQSYVVVSDLEQLAIPYMERLRDQLNETVQLATLDGTDNIYVAKVDADQQLRLASRVGVRLPAYATGIGKALLSQLDDDDIRQRFAGVKFQRYTPQTLGSLSALLGAVREIRERGYAVDNSEYTPGVYCIAVPLSGRPGAPRAALSVSFPEVRKTPALIKQTIASVTTVGQEICSRMGYAEAAVPTPGVS
jgi:IclR family acetate operon transcriptional repressor